MAADRDQAASDHDLALGADAGAHEFSHDVRQRTAQARRRASLKREQTANARLASAENRDKIATVRDIAATARDQAAAARDLALAQGDDADARADAADAQADTDAGSRAATQRRRAAELRERAAQHRALAAEDRRAAAEDREQAARERLRALVDREALARQVSLAEMDPLTGARTRAAGLVDLAHELERARRLGAPLVVAYVDIIGLKAVNDAEGHAAGDELIQHVVQVVKAHLRPYDVIVRIGGDEFLCVMSNMSPSDARQRFDAITGAPYNCAIRTGFAEMAPDDTAAGLIARADRELVASRKV